MNDALSAGLLLRSSGEQVTVGRGSSSRPHSWPGPPMSSYKFHAAPSLPGNPSGAGDVAMSEPQTDPRSTAVEYLATLRYADGPAAGDKPGTMRHEVSGGWIGGFTTLMECSLCQARLQGPGRLSQQTRPLCYGSQNLHPWQTLSLLSLYVESSLRMHSHSTGYSMSILELASLGSGPVPATADRAV